MSSGVDSRYDSFKATGYFPALDGLRAISVLLVLADHTLDPICQHLHGNLGVTVFFVISGFLITTLLLRENERDGKVSLRGFYLRRAFRIFPLYYFALIVFSLLVLAGLATDSGDYPRRFLFFMTYLNEFSGQGTFGHSWSLGVEEKFYLVWPLLAFVVPFLARHRLPLAAALAGGISILGLVNPVTYLSLYGAILVGCLLAVLMNDERTFRWLALLATPAASIGLGLLILATFVLDSDPGPVHVILSLVVAAALPSVLIGPRWARSWLTFRPLVFVGRRSYAIYLIHPLVMSAIDLVLPNGEPWWDQLVRLVALIIGSIVFADVLYRVLERPMIRLGYRLSGRSKDHRGVPETADAEADVPEATAEPRISTSPTPSVQSSVGDGEGLTWNTGSTRRV